ncbi:MAG: hypothetical protein ACXACY_28545 [Candidatus Hodarchaeales archaeon]
MRKSLEIIKTSQYPICVVLSWLTMPVIKWPLYYLTLPIILVLSWLRIPGVLFLLTGPLIFVWAIILFVNLLIKRMFKKVLLFACALAYFVIPIASSAVTTVSYLNGSATLSYPGALRVSSIWWNLDRDLRCYKSDPGYFGPGDFLLSFLNNLVVKTLIRTFGPMKGAYTGYYPSSEEAIEILSGETADNIDYRELDEIGFIPESFQEIYKDPERYIHDIRACLGDLPIKYTWNTDKSDWERIKAFGTDTITLRFKIINARAFLLGDKCSQI